MPRSPRAIIVTRADVAAVLVKWRKDYERIDQAVVAEMNARDPDGTKSADTFFEYAIAAGCLPLPKGR